MMSRHQSLSKKLTWDYKHFTYQIVEKVTQYQDNVKFLTMSKNQQTTHRLILEEATLLLTKIKSPAEQT